MKEKIIGRLGRGIALTAVAAFGMASVAHADMAKHYNEGGISTPGYFSSMGSGDSSATFDQTQYDQVNLGPLSSTLWAPKRGAQGPIRGEEPSATTMLNRDIERRLGPIGGRDTP